MNKKTTSFIDDENVINAAHTKAKASGMNLSTVIRLLLRMWLNDELNRLPATSYETSAETALRHDAIERLKRYDE